jgi:branched-chain amino acid transport system substrate-binding protein
MAKADTFVQTLYRAGKNPTRESVRRAAENIRYRSPWLLKGVPIASSKRSAFPISAVKLVRWNGKFFQEFGKIIKTR